MGEKDAESAEPEPVANGNVEIEEKTEPVMKKTVEDDGVTEMEEENKVAEKVENTMDKEKVNDSKETEEKATNEDVVKEGGKDERMEDTKEEEEEKKQVAEEKMDMEIEEMNHGPTGKTKADAKVEDKADEVGEEEKPKESKEERSQKKRLRTKSGDGKKERSTKHETEDKESNTQREKKTKTSTDKKEEQKTPVALTIDRPVRERKSVERLVAVIEQDAAKEFKVEKGRGTALKDIPNVAYKLSRKKSDDTLKLLHTILFGRRGKAAQVKNNMSRFSGFAWHDDEEKQTLKLKEKLDKIFKDKLVEFCDVLDIPISATVRKEDIISKLIEFLVAPHATTTELLAEKEQSSKGKKRKRESKSASGSSTLSEGSAKGQKKTKGTPKKDSEPKPEDESEEDEETYDVDKDNCSERSEDEKSEPAEREGKENECEGSDKDKRKKKQGSAKSSAKRGTAEKTKTKKVTISKETNLPPKKEPLKSPSNRPKNRKDTNTKRSSGKNKDESIKENTSTPKTASTTVSPGKKILKVKDNLREEKLNPSDDELRNAISEILKEVDFNTATFTDIMKILAKRFNKDLMFRKPSIKLMIEDELTKIADAEEADYEKDVGGVVKDGKKPSSRRVKA